MIDTEIEIPQNYKSIQEESCLINFSMPSDLKTGSLLRTLVTSKQNGCFLELGTGTGLSLAWIVEGMDKNSKIITIDNEEKYLLIAKKHFENDERVKILCEDGNNWIKKNQDKQFDLIFADTWPGKYETLDEVLSMVKIGGLYVIDDMLKQPNWPDGHQDKVNQLIDYLEKRKDLILTKLNWSTGIIIASKQY
jgi:predicted O-methyltransferase YrrM